MDAVEILIAVFVVAVACVMVGYFVWLDRLAKTEYDGELIITKREDGTLVFSLEVTSEHDVIATKDAITFKVRRTE